MTVDQISRIQDCGVGAESCMANEALCVARGDFESAARWSEASESWSRLAFAIVRTARITGAVVAHAA